MFTTRQQILMFTTTVHTIHIKKMAVIPQIVAIVAAMKKKAGTNKNKYPAPRHK